MSRQAGSLYSSARYEEALALELQALQILPYASAAMTQNVRNERMMIFVTRADTANRRGDYAGAADLMARAIAANPAYAHLFRDFQARCTSNKLVQSALAPLEKGDYRKALRILSQAFRFDPKNTWAGEVLRVASERQELMLETNRSIKIHDAGVHRLRKDIKGIVPPLPEPKKIREGVILGLTASQKKADLLNLRTPFGGKEPKETAPCYATTDDPNLSLEEVGRGFLDNISYGKYTLKSERGKELVRQLSGTHFDRLIAHSNGATVSEALILEGVITVDELHVAGGDRAIANYMGYEHLIASGKVKKVVVWINPADIVPLGSSLVSLALGNKFDAKSAKAFAATVYDKLTGGKSGHNVEYRFLWGSQYSKGQLMASALQLVKGPWNSQGFDEFMENTHGIKAYMENIKTYLDRNGE